MKNYNQILLTIYQKELFNQDFKVVCKILAKELNLSTKDIQNAFYTLEKRNQIKIAHNKVFMGRDFSKQSLDNFNTTNLEKKLVVGTICEDEGHYFFVPLDKKLNIMQLIATDEVANNDGKRCVCEIQNDNYGEYAVLNKVFGNIDDPLSENIAIAYSHGFSNDFSNEVLEEVKNIPTSVSQDDMKGRVDLTDKFLMTIDPASCKDKDDAVYAERTKNGYRVYVAIADVSHYVKHGSELDKEAFKRGTSCYLGSGVYPMLPKELSNGICSLNYNEPRLSLVAEINIDNQGNIVKYDFYKAVIKVHETFCYEDAEKVHLCQEDKDVQYAKAKPHLDLLYEITDILQRKMHKRGTLEFESNEPDYRFNEDLTQVLEINNHGEERSHKVIEELMILANEATAMFFTDHQINGIYRVHKGVAPDKLMAFNQIIRRLGVMYKLGSSQQDLRNFVDYIQTQPAKEFLYCEMLKVLAKAKYSATCSNHFGLASVGYTHFTSPIRRYSDTLAHRIISDYLEKTKGNKNEKVKSLLSVGDIAFIAEHVNEREKEADEAERLSNKYLASVWAREHIGEKFEGIIYSLTTTDVILKKDAIFVTLPVENLNKLGEHSYRVSSSLMYITDKIANKHYKLGDKMEFVINRISALNYDIICEPAPENVDVNEEK